jgi:hypothetical protein
MKIIMTDTVKHTRKIISFNDFCKRYFNINCGKTIRILTNYRLLNNEVFTNRNYEYKREIN